MVKVLIKNNITHKTCGHYIFNKTSYTAQLKAQQKQKKANKLLQ